jgi:hypothetical protein
MTFPLGAMSSDRTKAERAADEASAEVRRLLKDRDATSRQIDRAIERRDLAWAAIQRERAKGR